MDVPEHAGRTLRDANCDADDLCVRVELALHPAPVLDAVSGQHFSIQLRRGSSYPREAGANLWNSPGDRATLLAENLQLAAPHGVRLPRRSVQPHILLGPLLFL